jgi:tetratricopeptide (TPR) repeat protein
MMMFPLLSLLLTAPAQAAPTADAKAATPAAPAPAARPPEKLVTTEQRFDQCVELATGSDPEKGVIDATAWLRDKGGFLARQCLGIALANQGKWQNAAQEFENAADAAEVAHDERAANYWAQAGNAWLAAGTPTKAISALDAALAAGTLKDVNRGEALFDHARALVATGNLPAARTDLDTAVKLAAGDPLIWLASATLARKMNDLPRARADIIEAFKLAPDDASIDLEVGNIAAAGGDADGARTAWTDAARLGGDGPAGQAAKAALKQFDAPTAPPPAPSKSAPPPQ